MNLFRTAISPLLLLLLFPALGAEPPPQPAWQSLSPALLERARKQDRLVLVDLSAEWCRFCKKMDRSTWPDERVRQSIEKYYIPARIEDEKEPELAEKYRHYGRPAFFVLDPNGKEIARKRGYLDARFMHWMLEGIAQEAGH